MLFLEPSAFSSFFFFSLHFVKFSCSLLHRKKSSVLKMLMNKAAKIDNNFLHFQPSGFHCFDSLFTTPYMFTKTFQHALTKLLSSYN